MKKSIDSHPGLRWQLVPEGLAVFSGFSHGFPMG